MSVTDMVGTSISLFAAGYLTWAAWHSPELVPVWQSERRYAAGQEPVSRIAKWACAGRVGGIAVGETAVFATNLLEDTVTQIRGRDAFPQKLFALYRVPDALPPVERPGAAGLVWDKRGRLIVADQSGRRLVAWHARENKLESLATWFKNRPLNGPHGVALGEDGDVFFTDPPDALPRHQLDKSSGLDFAGVFLLGPDGKLDAISNEISHPAGIAYRESTLYVANSDPYHAQWLKIRLENRKPKPTQVFADVQALAGKWAGELGPISVDLNGRVFAAGPGGIHVMDGDGTLLGVVATTQPVRAIAIDRQWLYFVAGETVYCGNINAAPALRH